MAEPIAYVTTFQGNSMTPTDFSLALEKISLGAKGKLSGVGVMQTAVNMVSVGDGWCIVKGRIVRVAAGDLAVSFSSSGNQNKFVILSVDLSTNEPGVISIMNSEPTDGDNFNSGGTRAYLKLATITVGPSSIVSCANADLLDMKAFITQETDLVTSSTAVSVVKNALITKSVSLKNQKIKANSYATIDITVPTTFDNVNYTPKAIAGFSIQKGTTNGANGPKCYFNRIYLNGAKVSTVVSNTASSEAIVDIIVYILYAKD